MDTDPYFDHGAASSSSSSTFQQQQQRPPTAGHRPNSSQDTDPRAAAPHPSPTVGNGNGLLPPNNCSTQRAPPSPKLAPSPPLPSPPAHAESSQTGARRNANAAGVTGALESDMFTPFVSPAPAPKPTRATPTNPPSSSEHLRHMMDEDPSTAVAPETSSRPGPAAPVAASAAVVTEEPSLLTCKPLDRVASTQGVTSTSSTHTATASGRGDERGWVCHRKPMERIVSQAGSPYRVAPVHHPVALKRARSLSDPPESHRPSAYASRSAVKYFRGTPRKKMRMWTAQDAAEQAQDERIMRQIRGRAQDHFIAAAREPPVNMRSLRVLDTNEVLRLPQMRHDLLFDNFGFRPIHTPITYSSTSYGLLSTMRSQIVHPSLACESTNRYWDCIRAEIEYGCRCMRWDVDGRVKECICGRWKENMSEVSWWKESRATWPSRLPTLIQTLRQILESLMASTTPCVNHYAHAMNRDGQSVHGPACPTVTHSLVPTLFAALDVEFLTSQVRRGNFDVNIFRVIGEAMKVHCAPVRDAMVDDMVATATGLDGCAPDVVSGLRKCFDCVEVMKLDIANHQVQSLKGVLWQQAEQNEMTTFINYLVAAHRTLATSKTFSWINAASKRVAMSTPPRERRHIMGQCACGSNTEFVIRSLADGFIDLVFGDWVESNEAWPPIVPSRRPGAQVTGHVFPSKVIVPEVLKMDSCRLKNFHAEMVDIAIAQAILDRFKAQYLIHNPKATKEEVASQVAQVRENYKHVMTLGNGLALARSPSNCPSDLSLHMAHRTVFARDVFSTLPHSQTDVELVNRLAQDFDRLIAVEVARPDAPAYQTSLANLRKLVYTMFTNTLLLHRVQPESFLYDTRGLDTKACTRGEPISTSVRLRVPARRFVSLSEPLTGQGAATTDPREKYHRPADAAAVVAARELFGRTRTESHAREAAHAAEQGFEPLVHEIRAVVDRMVKTADFNLCVFANLYGRQGMLVGTGQLQPLPELTHTSTPMTTTAATTPITN